MVEQRELSDIIADVKIARESKAKISWSPQEIAMDMLVASKQLQEDLEKYLLKDMDAPAKRVRRVSKVLETLGKAFRVQSVS
jgi:hypothetical protein